MGVLLIHDPTKIKRYTVMFKQKVGELLEKEMDRKDFLKTVGVAIVALTGATAVLRTLSEPSAPRERRTNGYGSSSYGGVKPRR